MKRFLVASFLVGTQFLTSGCSAVLSKDAAPIPQSANTQIRKVDAQGLSDVRPEVRRQANLLYHILVGEFAGYRGHLDVAVKQYLQAAAISDDPDVAQRATQIALYARDYPGAMVAAQRWAVLAPESLDACRTLAVLDLRQDKLAPAAAQLDRLIGLVQGDAERGFYLVSRLLAQEHDEKRTLTVMAMLVQRHKSDPYAWYAYAHLAAEADDQKLALANVDKALSLKPDWPDASLLKARILMQQGKSDEAVAAMRAAIKAHPDSRALRISFGRLLAEAKQFAQARQQFEYLLRKNPKDAELLYAISLLAIEDKHYDAAEHYLKRLLKTGQRTPDAYYYLGAIAEERHQYNRAITWYRKVRSGDRRVDAHIRVSMLVAKQHGVAKGRKELHKMQPPNSDAAVRFYVAEADMLRHAGRYKEAVGVVNNGLAQMPGNNDLLYTRALLEEKLDRLDLLEKDLKQILATDPDNAQALNALGYTLADRTKRYKEALAYIQKALALSPDEPAILDSMGWVQYRLGNIAASLDYLRRAYKLDQDSEIAAHLGEVLWVSGDRDAARNLLERAVKRDPKSKTLQQLIQRFKL
ncbi:MAG: tetratricopeptide repeat protein [Gammaproteobacteria bacterium]